MSLDGQTSATGVTAAITDVTVTTITDVIAFSAGERPEKYELIEFVHRIILNYLYIYVALLMLWHSIEKNNSYST